MKPKYIICENKAERDAVLRKLEEQGYVWVGEGEKPTEWNYSGWEDDEAIYFNLSHNTRKISWGNVSSGYFSDEPEMLKITANKFLCNNKPILITRKGRIVTAENKNTGEKAIATCSPTDTFDFGTGAMIAVARLIAQSDKGITKDAETVLRQLLGYDAEIPADDPTEAEELINGEHKYVVGDRVRVKAWEVMKGTPNFISTMRHLCGRTATITNVYYCDVNRGNHSYTISLEFDDNSGDTDWQYQACMVEPLDESKPEMPTAKFKVGDLVTLKDGLESGEVYDGITLLSNMYRNGNCKPLKVVEVDSNGHYSCAPTDESIDVVVPCWYSEEMLETWDENKIREGDIVRVVNTGLNYSTYPQWVGEHISDPYMAARYCYSSPNTERKYKVLKIAEHELNGRMLAFIEECNGLGHNKCYLIEVKGLEKVTE